MRWKPFTAMGCWSCLDVQLVAAKRETDGEKKNWSQTSLQPESKCQGYILLELTDQEGLERDYTEKQNRKMFNSTRASVEHTVVLGTGHGFLGWRAHLLFWPEKYSKEESSLDVLPTERCLGGSPVCTAQQTLRSSSFVP